MDLVKKYALFFLSLLLLFPTAVTFAHVFSIHEHIACDQNDTHLHEIEFECEIITYSPTPTLLFDSVDFTALEDTYQYPHYPDAYQFLSDYQKLAFALRGPPANL